MRLSRWDQEGEPYETEKFVRELSHWHLRHCSEAESTLVDRIRDLIDRCGYRELCTFDLPVVTSPADQYHLSQVIGFFKKR